MGLLRLGSAVARSLAGPVVCPRSCETNSESVVMQAVQFDLHSFLAVFRRKDGKTSLTVQNRWGNPMKHRTMENIYLWIYYI